MENSNNSGKVIGALLVGAALGAALGILFAPAKGKKTRKKWAAKAEDFSQDLKEKLDSFMEEAKQDFASTKKQGEAKGQKEEVQKESM